MRIPLDMIEIGDTLVHFADGSCDAIQPGVPAGEYIVALSADFKGAALVRGSEVRDAEFGGILGDYDPDTSQWCAWDQDDFAIRGFRGFTVYQATSDDVERYSGRTEPTVYGLKRDEPGPRRCTSCNKDIDEYADGLTLCAACEAETSDLAFNPETLRFDTFK